MHIQDVKNQPLAPVAEIWLGAKLKGLSLVSTFPSFVVFPKGCSPLGRIFCTCESFNRDFPGQCSPSWHRWFLHPTAWFILVLCLHGQCLDGSVLFEYNLFSLLGVNTVVYIMQGKRLPETQTRRISTTLKCVCTLCFVVLNCVHSTSAGTHEIIVLTKSKLQCLEKKTKTAEGVEKLCHQSEDEDDE